VKRREFITLVGGGAMAAWPLAARAQQSDRMRRIGFLITGSERDAELQLWIAAFKDGLQRLGWTDGHNVRIEVHWAGGDVNRRRAYAVELVGSKPDVIVASATSALTQLSQATRTIPIVFDRSVTRFAAASFRASHTPAAT